jgi:hypothetical protein
MATALIVFEQDGVPGTPGQAYDGAADLLVEISNSSNTGVTSWTIELVDRPPDSGLAIGVLASAVSNTPAASFTPDEPGCYRVKLTVSDGVTPNVDIRNFGIRNARGIIVPPYQKLPDPAPVLGSGLLGEKPDELNFSGQPRGWGGEATSGLMEEFFRTYDNLPFLEVGSTPFTADEGEPPFYIVDLPSMGTAVFNLPPSPRVGKVIRINTLGPISLAEKLTVNAAGGGTIGSFSSLQLFGETSATLVHKGSNDWAILGGKHDFYERSIVIGVQSTDLTTWTRIGSVIVDPATLINVNPDVIWGAVAETTDAADPAQVRLFNVTTSSVVAGSTLNFSSTTSSMQQTFIALAAGNNIYEAQLRLTVTGSPNRAICTQAQIIIAWFES